MREFRARDRRGRGGSGYRGSTNADDARARYRRARNGSLRHYGGTRRHEPGHPIQQHAGIAGDPRRLREHRSVVGRHAVDDGQPGVDVSSVAGISTTIDGGGEHDAAALLEPDKGIAPGGSVGRQVGAGDGNQASAFSHPRQRRCDMTQCGIRHSTIDMGRDRKRRVHQHHRRPNIGIEMIVDMRRIVPRDPHKGKQGAEKAGPGVGDSFSATAAPASSAKMASSPVPAEGSSN